MVHLAKIQKIIFDTEDSEKCMITADRSTGLNRILDTDESDRPLIKAD